MLATLLYASSSPQPGRVGADVGSGPLTLLVPLLVPPLVLPSVHVTHQVPPLVLPSVPIHQAAVEAGVGSCPTLAAAQSIARPLA